MKRSFVKGLGVLLMLAGLLWCVHFTARWHPFARNPSQVHLVTALAGLGCFLAGLRVFHGRPLWFQ